MKIYCICINCNTDIITTMEKLQILRVGMRIEGGGGGMSF
jgi:hypothetical protein